MRRLIPVMAYFVAAAAVIFVGWVDGIEPFARESGNGLLWCFAIFVAGPCASLITHVWGEGK